MQNEYNVRNSKDLGSIQLDRSATKLQNKCETKTFNCTLYFNQKNDFHRFLEEFSECMTKTNLLCRFSGSFVPSKVEGIRLGPRLLLRGFLHPVVPTILLHKRNGLFLGRKINLKL